MVHTEKKLTPPNAHTMAEKQIWFQRRFKSKVAWGNQNIWAECWSYQEFWKWVVMWPTERDFIHKAKHCFMIKLEKMEAGATSKSKYPLWRCSRQIGNPNTPMILPITPPPNLTLDDLDHASKSSCVLIDRLLNCIFCLKLAPNNCTHAS